jgi:MarR family transcriptional regulator for hemolysin
MLGMTDSVEQSIGYLLSDSARMLRREFDARVRELGMTGPQARLLLNLAVNEGENQGFYADRLDVEPISLTRMIDRMEESGLLERRRDPTDRRAWRVHLAPRGRELIEQVRSHAEPLRELLLAGLDPAQRIALASSLEVVRANLSATRDLGVAANG